MQLPRIRLKLSATLVLVALALGVPLLQCGLLVVFLCSFWMVHHQITARGASDEPTRFIGWLPHYGHGLEMMADSRSFVEKMRRKLPAGEPWSYYSNGEVHTIVSSEADLKEFHNTPEATFSFIEVFRQFQVGGWPNRGDVFHSRTHVYSPSLARPKTAPLAPLFHKMLDEYMATWGDTGKFDLRFRSEQIMIATSQPAIWSPEILKPGRYEAYLRLFAQVRGQGFPFIKQVWKKVVWSYIDPHPFKRHVAPLWDEFFKLLTPLINDRIEHNRRKFAQAEQNPVVGDSEADGKEDQTYIVDTVITLRLQRVAKLRKKTAETETAKGVDIVGKGAEEEETEEQIMSVTEIVNDLYGLAHGSVDNVPGTLAWSIYHLIRDEKLRDRIMSDVHELLQAKQLEYLEVEDLDRLPELTAVLFESNRMYWSGFTNRKVMKSVKLSNGKIIREGTFIGSHNLRRDPVLFPNPDVFDINRHIGADCQAKRAGVCFPAFGFGRHRCLGQAFAMLEITNAIYSLFKRFDLRLVSNEEPVLQKTQISGMLNSMKPLTVEYSRKAL